MHSIHEMRYRIVRGSGGMAVGKDPSKTLKVTSRALRVYWDCLISEMLLRETGISKVVLFMRSQSGCNFGDVQL